MGLDAAMARKWKIGDRVLASLNGTGQPRPGTVNGWIAWPDGRREYAVTFDGAQGHSMPCVILSAAT